MGVYLSLGHLLVVDGTDYQLPASVHFHLEPVLPDLHYQLRTLRLFTNYFSVLENSLRHFFEPATFRVLETVRPLASILSGCNEWLLWNFILLKFAQNFA